MDTVLLTILVLAATGGCAWFYWQMQRTEARIKIHEAQVRDQALLVGELADQLSMASAYLYEAMDQNLREIEHRSHRQRTMQRAEVSSLDDQADQAAEDVTLPIPDAENAVPPADEGAGQFTVQAELATSATAVDGAARLEETERPYHPHFQALALTAQGVDPVEIARRTGLGVEELRLLMRFQEELSLGG